MKYIDETAWARKPISDGFGELDYPFFSVTFPVEVTALYGWAKAAGVSVYHACIHAVMETVNALDPFLYKLRADGVVRHDFLSPSFTVPEGELFKIVTVDWRPGETVRDFSARAKRQAEAQETLFPDAASEARDDLVYISCLPWLAFTSLTNERSFDKRDSIPRLAWGRMTLSEGKRYMPFSVDVNHRLIDGRHIGMLSEALNASMGRDDMHRYSMGEYPGTVPGQYPGDGPGEEAET